MTKVSKATAEAQDIGVGTVYEQEVDGYGITILDMREAFDMAPLLRGLPDDLCSSEHWGYVARGRVTFTFRDHTEVFEAGDAFRVTPGHSPSTVAGTEWVLFSPADQMVPVNEVILRNVAATQSA
jgi:mannose-6-phosphate isomerase-like protein (cupin superfamily)